MEEAPTISVVGNASIIRYPERAILSLDVRSTGTDQTTVANNIKSTANKVKQMMNDLMPTTESGEATADAAITHWSMDNLTSSSWDRTSTDGKETTTEFTYRTSFSIKFRDFDKLGAVTSELAHVPYVEISNVSWKLTDATTGSLVSEARMMAAKNAIERATDYAKAFGYERVVPLKIEDRSSGSPSSTRASLMRTKKKSRDNDEDNTLGFSPEEVSLQTSVAVTFAANPSCKELFDFRDEQSVPARNQIG